MMVFISGTVTDTASRNFLKKSSTLVSSKDFSKSFETKYIKKLCLPSVRFKENASTKKFISAEVTEYLSKKELHSSHFKGVSQKLSNKANKKAFSAFRTFP